MVQQLANGVYLGKQTEKNSRTILEQAFLPNRRNSPVCSAYKTHDEADTTHLRCLPIRSARLPGFRAITAELSVEEAKVVLSGPLAEGSKLLCYLDLDDTIPPLAIQATVEWCQLLGGAFFVQFAGPCATF